VTEAVTKCPCCNSSVRVNGDDLSLEIVRIDPDGMQWNSVAFPVPTNRAGRRSVRPGDQEVVAVVRRIAERHGLSLAELRSPSREPHLVRSRWVAAAVARRICGASLPQLGRVLNRDHSTVLHGLRQLHCTTAEAA
jgi:hypothetical protein